MCLMLRRPGPCSGRLEARPTIGSTGTAPDRWPSFETAAPRLLQDEVIGCGQTTFRPGSEEARNLPPPSRSTAAGLGGQASVVSSVVVRDAPDPVRGSSP